MGEDLVRPSLRRGSFRVGAPRTLGPVTPTPTDDTTTVELIAIDDVEFHPDNPRRGDCQAIAQSIAFDGWHGAIQTQVRPGLADRVINGEHRTRALRILQADGYMIGDQHLTYDLLRARHRREITVETDEGMVKRTVVMMPPAGYIPAERLPITDDEARAKMLDDNRASDLAVYEDDALLAALTAQRDAGGLDVTLWTDDDLTERLAALDPEPPPSPPDEPGERKQVAFEARKTRCPACGHEW